MSPVLAAVIFGAFTTLAAQQPTPEQTEFFETKIRPVLVEHCYKCHNSSSQADGELAVDHRAALLKGGERGAIIVPGKPNKSRLLAILRHEVTGLKMPQDGAKLSDRVIADFAAWIEMGAPDPRDKPPSAADLAKATSFDALLKTRKQWWSFQPIRDVAPPAVENKDWSEHPVDRFIFAKLSEKQLRPSAAAEPRTLVRRLFFAVIGLPPTADEAEHWTQRLHEPGGYESLVDHLLQSPHFGERWARHWMDWIRYADSHGSEGDPAIDNAWRFRDYLIEGLNHNVSFDQLVREQIAGDLLEQPRHIGERPINEALLGPAHWRMVFHGFAPTDALEEKVRFVDDQINAFSKAFLGLTVSCARCHDHKFDPISQRDYYALFGILGSCRLGRAAAETPEFLNQHRPRLMELKKQLRATLAAEWNAAIRERHDSWFAADGAAKEATQDSHVLNLWHSLQREVEGAEPKPGQVKGQENNFASAWKLRAEAWRRERSADAAWATEQTVLRQWNFGDTKNGVRDFAAWRRVGNGLPDQLAKPGEFVVATSGDHVVSAIYPAGVYSHALSTKHAARFSSDYVRLSGDQELWVRAFGDGGATVRYVVQHYPRSGTVYPIANLKNEWNWQRFDLTYWDGDDIHLELTTAKDAPLQVKDQPQSWFGVRQAVVRKKGSGSPPDRREFLDPLFEAAETSPPQSFDELKQLYQRTLAAACDAWGRNAATDGQALLLDAALRQRLLPNGRRLLPQTEPLLEEYRRLEAEVPVATRVPNLEEMPPREQPLYVRGNHKTPGNIVPRRFLEAIDATPFPSTSSGRRELAEAVLRPDNPLTRRVIVNRLWHHLFGRGIVATPDNLGRLGIEPTHPELLDFLATRFRQTGGDLKGMIRFLLLSKTWRQSSRPSAEATRRDPDNLLLSHANVRRLEAEAIRDALLTTSGTLDRKTLGPPVEGGSPRRSIYVRVQRNSLDPLLRAFDFPEPFSAVGRRDVTNVPAQSLVLMNDSQVAAWGANWTTSLLALTDEQRLRQMFLAAFARPPRDAEIQQLRDYLAEAKSGQSQVARQIADVRREFDRHNAVVRQIVEPVRARLLAEAKSSPPLATAAVPQPIGRWEFETDLRDSIGTAHGEARGGAKLDSGAVVVGSQSHVVTAALTQRIKEKTLEAWVRLDTLDQQGGGVMTIQTPNGNLFDSIVFGEKNPRQWMAGSNHFQRTQSFQAREEDAAATRPVHVAIAYHGDGKIVGYRDGQPYGSAYQSNGPIEFAAGQAVISFGVRHLPPGGNRMLAGRVLRANLYDRALSAAEIAATSQAVPLFVPEEKIAAALSLADRQRLAVAKQRVFELEKELQSLGPAPAAADDKAAWTDVARTLFTFQEFIFVP